MFQNSGLSLEQAPPIVVVLRFFITGSIFGVIASIMLFFIGADIANFSLPQTIALTHLFTLGVMGSFMFGALYQMLPVLCGVHIKGADLLALRVNYIFIFGITALVAAFFTNAIVLYIVATLFLAYAIFFTAFAMLGQLRKIQHNNSSRGMMLSLTALIVVAVLGITLLAIRGGLAIDIDYLWLKEMHYSFGLFGWISLLIISVSFQVIEMFYVTPSFPKGYAKNLPIAIIALLFIDLFFSSLNPQIRSILQLLVVLLIAFHAGFILLRLKQKKRPVIDATILFWILGEGAFIAFAVALIATFYVTLPPLLLVVLFSFFPLSVIFAMSYKIVPFLVWFHLNAQGYFNAPMMHEVTPPSYAKRNFYIFLGAFVTAIIAVFLPVVWYLSALLLMIAFFMLFLNNYRAWHKYQEVLESGEKFSFT